MAEPISALERMPSDLIREVSMGTIRFYTDDLSGLYLPEDFKEANEEGRSWLPDNRLFGKFGRFALHLSQEDGQPTTSDILLMGTTIGLGGIDHRGNMHSLRHYELRKKAISLHGPEAEIEDVDYGATGIVLDKDGKPVSIIVCVSSFDFGRADTEGRGQTCRLFEELLGREIAVINESPEPGSHEKVIAR